MNGRAAATLVLIALVVTTGAAILVFVDVMTWARIGAGPFLFDIHPILPLVVGVLIAAGAAGAAWLVRLRTGYGDEAGDLASWTIASTIIAIATMCVIVTFAVARGLNPVTAVLMLTLGTATLIAAGYTFRLFHTGGSLRFDSNWGGLGGGQGGWRVSSSTAMALLFLVLLGTTAAIGAAALSDGAKGNDATENVADEKGSEDNPAENKAAGNEGAGVG